MMRINVYRPYLLWKKLKMKIIKTKKKATKLIRTKIYQWMKTLCQTRSDRTEVEVKIRQLTVYLYTITIYWKFTSD